jgi:DNA-binding CsgD family transcriptional regulator
MAVGAPVDRRQIPQWLADVLGMAGDGAFAVDGGQRIVLWNAAAQNMLGLSPGEVVGRRCYDVLCGRDPTGDLICCPRCPLLVMAQRGERIASRDMVVPGRGGDPRWLNVSTVALPHGMWLAHLFRDVSEARARERLANEVLAGRLHLAGGSRPAASALTPREREILQHLARGTSTRQIASALFISPLTARNHVQRILRKLGASTRAQAVAIALHWPDGS